MAQAGLYGPVTFDIYFDCITLFELKNLCVCVPGGGGGGGCLGVRGWFAN